MTKKGESLGQNIRDIYFYFEVNSLRTYDLDHLLVTIKKSLVDS